jgi:hypothetical protein
MPDFADDDLTGSRFDDVILTGAHFRRVYLTNARFEAVDLTGAFRGVDLVDVEVSGDINNLSINGVDVAPLIDAELDRRYPDRAKMRPTDADGFREAWSLLEQLWGHTVERARTMPSASLHERVGGEWSFIETLRHLVFATDAWVRRAILGEPSSWDRLDLPHAEMEDMPNIPRDRNATPSLDVVLALRDDRAAAVRQVLADLTDDALGEMTTPVSEPGYPASESFPISQCLRIVLNEEWQHRLYAERDLDALDSGAT